VNRRLELKTELLKMEGAGFSKADIVQELHTKFKVATKTVYYYYRTRHEWQPAILGLAAGKEAFHQTLNRLDYIYQKFSYVHLQAHDDNNKIGALKGMLETTLKKAELTGILVPNQSADEQASFMDLIDREVMETLTPEEEAIVMKAAELFQKKREAALATHEQEDLKQCRGVS